MLFGFGTSGIKLFETLKSLKVTDAGQVEVAYLKNPENVFLASILQSHALIKWSDNLK